MKKKLKLEDLKVQSFITLEKSEEKNVLGGMQQPQSYHIPCSDFARCTPEVTEIICETLIQC
jgi:hypothetical protein